MEVKDYGKMEFTGCAVHPKDTAAIAAIVEKQRIISVLLALSEEARKARLYQDSDRYRDAAWLVDKA